MQTSVKTIPEQKLATYLKLKKTLAVFVGVGQYFESKTFDWIRLDQFGDGVKCFKIRSFDEGDEAFQNVASFSTVNDLERETEYDATESFEGNLQECLNWIRENQDGDLNRFVSIPDLDLIYAQLVTNGKLGN